MAAARLLRRRRLGKRKGNAKTNKTPRAFRKPVTLVEAIPAPPEPIAESEDGITNATSAST